MVTPCNSQLPTWVRIGMQIICELHYSVGCNLNNNILLKTVVVLHIKTYFLLYQVVIGFLWLIFFLFCFVFYSYLFGKRKTVPSSFSVVLGISVLAFFLACQIKAFSMFI